MDVHLPLGVNLAILGGWGGIGALYLPIWSTPEHGGWLIWNYPLLLTEGLLVWYALPPIAALVVLLGWLFFAIGDPPADENKSSIPSILLGLVVLLLGLGGLGLLLFLYYGVLLPLFFSNLVPYTSSYGFYIDILAHTLTIASGLSFIFYRPKGGNINFQTLERKTSPRNTSSLSSSASKQQTSDKQQTSTLKKRKKKESKEEKTETTNTTKNKNKNKNKNRNSKNNNRQKSEVLSYLNYRGQKGTSFAQRGLRAGVHIILFVAAICVIISLIKPEHQVDLTKIKLPKGFKIDIYARDVPNARSLALGDRGVVFVGTRNAGNGRVYALIDRNNDNKADEMKILVEGWTMPNGVAFANGSLYVAEVSRLWRFDDVEAHVLEGKPLKRVLVRDNWPMDTHHGWKFIRFNPRQPNMLYVPIGAPCNVCLRPDDPRYATIIAVDVSIDINSSRTRNVDTIYAEGIRNSVGFDWHPDTGDFWFTENGRDFASEDYPPDELNMAWKAGLHFGYPYCFGVNHPDPEINFQNSVKNCSQFAVEARRELQPHVAAIGMRFYPTHIPTSHSGKYFPAKYRGQMFVAEHGSWNRKEPLGMK